MDLKALRHRVYEKYKINVDEKDPAFLIVALMIEESLEVEKGRYTLIQQQVDEIVRGAAQAAEVKSQALFNTTDQTIREFKGEYALLIQEIRDSKAPDENDKGFGGVWIVGLFFVSIMNTVALVILLLAN